VLGIGDEHHGKKGTEDFSKYPTDLDERSLMKACIAGEGDDET